MRGLRRGSTLMRWSTAFWRMFSVVVMAPTVEEGAWVGEGATLWLSLDFAGLDTGEEVIMREVLGERRTALVRLGSARRVMDAGLGFEDGVDVL